MSFQKLIPALTYMHTGPGFSRIGQWLKHFDVEFYRTHPHWEGHADLEQFDHEHLRRHFIETGWREGRAYSRFLHSFIAPDFYCREYPELGLNSPQDAARHWMYEGFYEGRIPNAVTKDVLESEFHLFQFGKVGSKSIEQALRVAGHDRTILHLHWPSDMLTTYPDCMFSYEEVVARDPEKPIRFITGVRDPFERIISGYFQSNPNVAQAGSIKTVGEISDAIVTSYFSSGQVDWILGWFAHQFFRGIDVFSSDFDKSAGYTVLECNHAKVFLYRMENLPHLEEPLSRFTGLPIRLQRVNTATDKAYSGLYKEVIETLRFSEADVDLVMNSQLVRHFYSEQEIERMRERWTAK